MYLKAIYILIILAFSKPSISQQAGNYYKGFNCEYLNFLNDSVAAYHLNFAHWGAMACFNKGVCKYYLTDSILILSIRNDLKTDTANTNDSACNDSEIESKDYQFQILIYPQKGICLIGPIIKDYQKMNRKLFLKRFMNWPWKWSFRKQHWFDPVWQELKLQ